MHLDLLSIPQSGGKNVKTFIKGILILAASPLIGQERSRNIPTPLKGNGRKWVYPPLFQTKVGGGKMQTSSPPVITPNRSQSSPDDMITLPRPIQSVGMNLHDVSGTSTGQTLPRERRAPPGTHLCPTIWWVYLLLFLSSTHYCPLFHPLLSEIYPL